MKKRPFIIWMIGMMILISITSLSYGQEMKKVILIVMNEASYEDLANMPVMKKKMSKGAIALMNTRTSSKENIYKAYVTLGAGVRAEGDSYIGRSFKIGPHIEEIYKRRTGKNIAPTGFVNIYMPRLIRLNERGQYGAIPGALGQALHDKGMKTAVFGNADTDEAFNRLACSIAMDTLGYIDNGNIGKEVLTKDPMYPFGIKNNYKSILMDFENIYKSTALTVIEMGDLGRLERIKPDLSDDQYDQIKGTILKDANDFLEQVMKKVDLNHTQIITLTPYPGWEAIKEGNKLTPVVFFGDNIQKGVLTSDTTRRTGIIGNVDIAPSIAQYLDADAKNMSGRSIHVIPKNDSTDYIMDLNEKVVSTSKNRLPVLSTYAVFEITICILGILMILLQHRFSLKMIYVFQNILLGTMVIPFVLLILPMMHINNIFMTYVVAILLILLITYSTKKFSRNILDSLIILSGLTTLGLLIDVCNGSILMKNSLLGYDPIIGARYYGIGNEYMGVVIGSTLVFATAILDRFKANKMITLFIFMVTIVIIGFPKLGANVGGTMTAVAAFLFVALRIYKISIKFKQLIIIGVCIVCVVALMAFIDIKFVKSHSHLAGAIEQILQGGPTVVLLIIERKISMNLRLIGVTIWSKVLISAIMILGTLFYRPVGTLGKLAKIYPNLSIGWSGIIMACIVAFFVNDSGIVAAGTGITFLAMSMLYLTFHLIKEHE